MGIEGDVVSCLYENAIWYLFLSFLYHRSLSFLPLLSLSGGIMFGHARLLETKSLILQILGIDKLLLALLMKKTLPFGCKILGREVV